mgnify:FL=1
MKKLLVLLVISLIFSSPAFAENTGNSELTTNDVVLFTQNERWGLKDKTDKITVEPIYRKMIRVGTHSWIVQNKKYKFGLIDSEGNVLVPIKYRNADRIVSKFAKFGNDNDYGIYDEFGNTIVKPEYSKIDILFGQMFLTCKNYKYGIVGYDGRVILENKFDDIYMPKPNVMRISYNGEWYELQQVKADSLTLPADAEHNLATQEDLSLQNIVVNTGVISSYSVVTFSDYLIKLISSISPSHEDTIDELMLSKGADTVSIFMKLSWIPKYPVVYCKHYYRNVRNPNNGPLSNVKKELKRQIK